MDDGPAVSGANYVSDGQGNWYALEDLENVKEYEYFDGEVGWDTEACYKVNALWGLNGDTCMSEYALQEVPVTDEVCVFLFDGVSETTQNDIICFPNPTSNSVNIKSRIKIAEYAILNLQGQLLFDLKTNGVFATQQDISFLNPGLYILKVITEKGTMTRKFLKTE